MHVQAWTALAPGEVAVKLGNERRRSSVSAAGALRCELEREIPKIFLAIPPFTFPPAAEMHVDPDARGSHVILRLMWGPLPAPFPRALAGVGLLLGLGLLAVLPLSAATLATAVLVAGIPAAALWCQRIGERQLQGRLSALLGDCAWTPRPHESGAIRRVARRPI